MKLRTYHLGFLFIYLAAFTSLYIQIPGLYGSNGLTPIFNNVGKYFNMPTGELLNEFTRNPTLLIFHGLFPLSPEILMELITLCGIGLSILAIVFSQMRSMGLFAIIWLLYLSCYKVGGVFMWFQWDILLLEAGFLTALSAPIGLWIGKSKGTNDSVSKDRLMVFLLRWLLFRLMFASGIVKLTSHCPTWWSLTALNYHYESQCIPTPIAWYVHHFPEWIQKLSVVGTYYIEIVVPFFFFMPIKALRHFSFLCEVFFQLCIIATGNYNFFNLLTIVLCMSLLITQDKSKDRKKILYGTKILWAFGVAVLVVGVIMFSMFYTSAVFGTTISVEELIVNTHVSFTYKEFERWLEVALRVAVVEAFLAFVYEVSLILRRFLRIVTIYNGLICICTIVCSSVLFTVSLVPLSTLDATFYQTVPKGVHETYSIFNKYAICNHYGLFRRMTGIGGRPEVVLEGTDSLEGDWKELEFFYKPGNVSKSPPFVTPHQPRLDWQMWFAALGSYHENPWLIHLAYRLLIGESDVLKLMGPQAFQTTPLYIRANLFLYNYSQQASHGNSESTWWVRNLVKEYFPPLSWQEPTLLEFLKHHGYLNSANYNPPENVCSRFLAWIRSCAEGVAHHVLVWILIIMAASCSLVAFCFKV